MSYAIIDYKNTFFTHVDEIFEEINTMKSEMETYLQTMDKLYGEIESRDGIIKQLKNDKKGF